MKKIRIKDDWDQLAKDACEADNRGITYGKMMGLRYEQEQQEIRSREEERRRRREARKEQPGFCRNCGNPVSESSNRRYFCCVGCEGEFERKRLAEEAIEDPRGAWAPKKGTVCRRCGKKVKGNRVYCSAECREAQKLEDISLRNAKEKEKRPVRMCYHCGHEITDEKRMRYCSDKCMLDSTKARARELRQRKAEARK